MKKAIGLLLAVLLTVSLFGCNSKKTLNSTTETPDTHSTDKIQEENSPAPEKQSLKNATELFDEGKTEEAFEMVKQLRQSKEVIELKEKCKKILLEPYKEMLDEKYDDMDEKYTIRVPFDAAKDLSDEFYNTSWVRFSKNDSSSASFVLNIGTFTDISNSFIWLDKIKLKGGEISLDLEVDFNGRDSEVLSGLIQEGGRVLLNSSQLETLQSILATGSVNIRFSGSNSYLDRTLSVRTINNLKLLIEYYMIISA